MNDEFGKELLPCSWRDIHFPISVLTTEITQDLAEHKRADRDGAAVESTGRNPTKVTATALFFNNLRPGPGEEWKYGALFPGPFRQFTIAMADRSTGQLNHPLFGRMTCKPIGESITLSAESRDGVSVTASWVEHDPSEDLSSFTFTRLKFDPATFEVAARVDKLVDRPELKRADPDTSETFESAMRKITAGVDKVTLLNRQAIGRIDRVLYRVDSLQRAIVEAKDPQLWQAKEALSILRSSLVEYRKNPVRRRDVRLYITPAPTSLANVANKFANTVGELLSLNPDLVSKPGLEARTVVRYYQKDGAR